MALTSSSGGAGGARGADGSQAQPCAPVQVAEDQHFPRGGLAVARGALAAPGGEQSGQGGCATPVPPRPKRPLGLYLERGGISWPRAALWAPWVAGAAGGRRELLQERTAVGGWSVHPHPAVGRMTAHPGPPFSPAAGGQSWVWCRAVGASLSGCGGHEGCGHCGAGAGCHRSCGWLCGMGQLGCHH